jgi:precorrin-6A/cobalt-precorrin-6A reductase
MERIDCDVLVSNNSDGQATEHQLQAACERGIPAQVLKRPKLPAVEREFGSGEALLAGLAEGGWHSRRASQRRVENDRRSFPPGTTTGADW